MEFNGQIIPFENISYERNELYELNEKQNENVAQLSYVNCEFLQKDEDLILINNDDCDFTKDYFRDERVRKNKEKPISKIKTFYEINDVYEGENISQKNSRVVEKDFSSEINKCCENGDRYKRNRDVKIFSEMGDNVVFRCEENCVEDIIEHDIEENYVGFNCGKFYVGGNKNNELSKKPCENVSEEEDLITFENENFSENFDEYNVSSKKEVIFENDFNCNISKNEVSNIERELFKEEIITVYDNIECLGNNENKSLCEIKFEMKNLEVLKLKKIKVYVKIMLVSWIVKIRVYVKIILVS